MNPVVVLIPRRPRPPVLGRVVTGISVVVIPYKHDFFVNAEYPSKSLLINPKSVAQFEQVGRLDFDIYVCVLRKMWLDFLINSAIAIAQSIVPWRNKPLYNNINYTVVETSRPSGWKGLGFDICGNNITSRKIGYDAQGNFSTQSDECPVPHTACYLGPGSQFSKLSRSRRIRKAILQALTTPAWYAWYAIVYLDRLFDKWYSRYSLFYRRKWHLRVPDLAWKMFIRMKWNLKWKCEQFWAHIRPKPRISSNHHSDWDGLGFNYKSHERASNFSIAEPLLSKVKLTWDGTDACGAYVGHDVYGNILPPNMAAHHAHVAYPSAYHKDVIMD